MSSHHFESRAKRRSPLPAWALTLVLGALVQACGTQDEGAGFGLELVKPAGWSYVSGGVNGVQGEAIRYDRSAIAAAISGQHNAPLFALLKRAPPQATFNPTFGINLERDAKARGHSPVELLNARVIEASRHGPFTLIAPAAPTRLAGLPAAQAELRLAQPAAAMPAAQTRVRLHLLVVDDITLLLAETDALSGDNEASAAFEQVRASLRLPGAASTP